MATSLDNTQLQALKTDITVTNAAVSYQGDTLLGWWNLGVDNVLAAYYNEIAVPAVALWRKDYTKQQAVDGISWVDFIGSGINEITTFAQVLFGDSGLDMTQANNRAAFLEIFAGPQNNTTRRDILTRGTKSGTNGEVLFAGAPVVTDTISASVSAIYGQNITPDDIAAARGV